MSFSASDAIWSTLYLILEGVLYPATFVEPDDIPGLAAAIKRYLDDPAAACGASERGVARASRYSWDASAAILLDRYRQIA